MGSSPNTLIPPPPPGFTLIDDQGGAPPPPPGFTPIPEGQAHIRTPQETEAFLRNRYPQAYQETPSVGRQVATGAAKELGNTAVSTLLGPFSMAIQAGRTAARAAGKPDPLDPQGPGEEAGAHLAQAAEMIPGAWPGRAVSGIGRAVGGFREGRALDKAVRAERVRRLARDIVKPPTAKPPAPEPVAKPDLKGAQARESMRRVISKQEGVPLPEDTSILKQPEAGVSTRPFDAPAYEPPLEVTPYPAGKGTGTKPGGLPQPFDEGASRIPKRAQVDTPPPAEAIAKAPTPFRPNPRIARLVQSGGSDTARSIPGRPSRRGNLPGEGYTLDTYEKPGAEVPKANPVVTTVEEAAEEAVQAAEKAAPRARPVVKKGPQKSAAVRKAEEELAAGVAPKGVKRKKGDPVILGDDAATTEFKVKEAKSIKILGNIVARLKRDGITPDNVARARASVKARGISVDLFEDFLTDIKKGGAKFALGGVVDAAPAQKSRVRHSKRGIPYGPPQELRKLRKATQ